MRARRAIMALAAVLTGCGTPAATTTPSPASSPSPVPGTTVRTVAFTTVVPPGWIDHTGDATAAAAAVASMPGGTALLVVDDPSAGARVAVVELAFPVVDTQLAPTLTAGVDPGAINLSVAKPVDIGGVTGEAVTYDRDVAGAPAETEEALVTEAGHTDDIRFTVAQASYDDERAGLLDILAAWEWAG